MPDKDVVAYKKAALKEMEKFCAEMDKHCDEMLDLMGDGDMGKQGDDKQTAKINKQLQGMLAEFNQKTPKIFDSSINKMKVPEGFSEDKDAPELAKVFANLLQKQVEVTFKKNKNVEWTGRFQFDPKDRTWEVGMGLKIKF